MGEPISVVVADDHTGVRQTLRSLLSLQRDITVVGDASDGLGAVEQAELLQPDVVVMDVVMPQLDGIEASRRIRERCPSTQIVVLSMHCTPEYVQRAVAAGARAYLAKENAGSELVEAVRAVHRGGQYFSARVAPSGRL